MKCWYLLQVFNVRRVAPELKELELPKDLTVREALNQVLRLPSVASKRYLTNKVDRSVTGLVAQQQCVGPLHTPLADVAVVALSHFDKVRSVSVIHHIIFQFDLSDINFELSKLRNKLIKGKQTIIWTSF